MRKTSGLGVVSILVVALSVGVTSCNKSGSPTTAQDQSPAQYPSSDPAQENLAAAGQYGAAPVRQASAPARQPQSSYPAQSSYSAQPGAQPPPQSSYPAEPSYPTPPAYQKNDAGYADDADNAAYGEQPVEAEQPPPPLPEYPQPPCPGENYLWTPGTWAYASAGYYWVPGVWVLAPFVGALWTPPYWGFVGGRYHWHQGYWGHHIGFYGGVNYGYGYFGRGYEGGYWNRDHFAYNRTVNNVNTTVVRNVYNYRVTNITNNRISYNGGNGGLNVRPTGPEIAALHEQRMAPVAAQVKLREEANANRAQFAAASHGRPETLAQAHPLATTYREPAPHPGAVPGARVLPPVAARQQTQAGERLIQNAAPVGVPNGNRAAYENRSAQPQPRGEGRATPQQQVPQVQQRPVPQHPVPPQQPRMEQRSTPPQQQPRIEQRPAPPPQQPRMEQRSTPPPQQPRIEQRPAPQPRVEQRAPQVEQRPVPQAEPRSAPQPQPQHEQREESRPAPQAQPRPAPEARPAPESRPAPEAHPAPAPHAAPAPPAKPNESHPHS